MNGGCCGRGKVGEGEGVLFCDAFDTHAAVILLRCAFDVWHVCRRYRPSGVIEMTKSKRRCWYVRFVVLYCKERRRWQEQQKDRLQKKTRWPCVRMTTYNVDEWEKCNKYGTDCEWAAYNRTTPVRCDGPEPQQPKSMDPPQNKVLLAGNGW